MMSKSHSVQPGHSYRRRILKDRTHIRFSTTFESGLGCDLGDLGCSHCQNKDQIQVTYGQKKAFKLYCSTMFLTM